MQSIINSMLPEFKVQAFQNGEFRTVSSEDVKGKWAVFLFYTPKINKVFANEMFFFGEKK